MSDACIDIPDARDFKFRDVFFGASSMRLPKRVFLNMSSVQNQNIHESTRMGCVFYTAAHIINEENMFEFAKHNLAFDELNGSDLCKQAFESNLLNIQTGAKLQSGPRIARKNGYISGSTLVTSLEEYKQACVKRQGVQVGSNEINWEETMKNHNIIVPGKSYGHSMMGAGYDDNLRHVILRNSNGLENHDKGYLYLKYDDWNILYPSKYAYVDMSNADTIIAYQKRKRLQDAKDRGYWNTQRPNDFATRYECAMIALKVQKYHKHQIPEIAIWNGKDKNANVVVAEAQAMFERASGKKFDFYTGDPKSQITRSDLVCLAVRI